MKDILAQGSKIWVNTLWASLCGGEEAGIYDDYAFEHGAEVYQKVLDFGTSIIQTDRPEFLVASILHKPKGRFFCPYIGGIIPVRLVC